MKSDDLRLLQALVACAGVTLKAVSTALDIPIREGRVHAEGDIDFRGTLGVEREAPVGFTDSRVRFELDTDASEAACEPVAAHRALLRRVSDAAVVATSVGRDRDGPDRLKDLARCSTDPDQLAAHFWPAVKRLMDSGRLRCKVRIEGTNDDSRVVGVRAVETDKVPSVQRQQRPALRRCECENLFVRYSAPLPIRLPRSSERRDRG